MELTSYISKSDLENSEIIKFGAWTLSLKQQTITDSKGTRELEPLIFELLTLFILKADKIVTRQELVDEVWQQKFVDDNSINRAMSELRKVLKSQDYDGQYIKTHYKKGYRFLPEVQLLHTQQSESLPEREGIKSTSQMEDDSTSQAYANQSTIIPSAANQAVPKSSEENQNDAGYGQEQKLSGSNQNSGPNHGKYTKSRNKLAWLALFVIVLSIVASLIWHFQSPVSVADVQDNEIQHAVASRTELSWQRGLYMSPRINQANSRLAFSYRKPGTKFLGITVRNLETNKTHSIENKGMDTTPIVWQDNHQLIYRTLSYKSGQDFKESAVNCAIWRATIDSVSGSLSTEKLMTCHSAKSMAVAVHQANNELIYTKDNYRGKKGLHALVAHNLETGMEYQITSPQIESGGDYYVKMSPKGDKLAFVRATFDAHLIYISALDGSEKQLVSTLKHRVGSIRWGNNGKTLTWFNPRKWQLNTYDLNSQNLVTTNIDVDYNVDTMFATEVAESDRLIIGTSYYNHDITSANIETGEYVEVAFSGFEERRAIPFNNSAAAFYTVTDKDRSVWLLNENGKQLYTQTGSLPVYSIIISPDDSQVAIQSKGQVNFYSVASKELLTTTNIDEKIYIKSWWSPNTFLVIKDFEGKRIAGTLTVDGKTFTPISQDFVQTVKPVSSRLVAVLDHLNNIKILDAFTGDELKSISHPHLTTVNWTVLNNKLFFGSEKTKVLYVDLEDKELKKQHYVDLGGYSANRLYSAPTSEFPILYIAYAGLHDNTLIDIKLAKTSK